MIFKSDLQVYSIPVSHINQYIFSRLIFKWRQWPIWLVDIGIRYVVICLLSQCCCIRLALKLKLCPKFDFCQGHQALFNVKLFVCGVYYFDFQRREVDSVCLLYCNLIYLYCGCIFTQDERGCVQLRAMYLSWATRNASFTYSRPLVEIAQQCLEMIRSILVSQKGEGVIVP